MELSAKKNAGLVRNVDPAWLLVGMKVTIHRGPIPDTNIGHHWFVAADGNRYGIEGGPGTGGGNRGWAYEVVDAEGQVVDDLFTFPEVRSWAAWTRVTPTRKDQR